SRTHKTSSDAPTPPPPAAISPLGHPHPSAEAAKSHSTPPQPEALRLHSPAPRRGSAAGAPESALELPSSQPASAAARPAPVHSSRETYPQLPPAAPSPETFPPLGPTRQSSPPSSAVTLQSCSSRSSKKSAPDAVQPQNSSTARPSTGNPETPRQQLASTPAEHRSPRASAFPQSPSHVPSDYSDSPPQQLLSGVRSASQTLQNRSTSPGHKTADSSSASHPRDQPENQTADNSAARPEPHHSRRTRAETNNHILHLYWSSVLLHPDQHQRHDRRSTPPPPPVPIAFPADLDHKSVPPHSLAAEESPQHRTETRRPYDSTP